MKYEVLLSENAKNDLAALDPQVARRILEKLAWFITLPNPLDFAKRLHYNDVGDYRFRVGDYRIIFDISQSGEITVLEILRVKHRREVYK